MQHGHTFDFVSDAQLSGPRTERGLQSARLITQGGSSYQTFHHHKAGDVGEALVEQAEEASCHMHVSLTPELDRAVKEKVASALYNNASEVIREALRLTLKHEAENEWLKREAAIGFAQLEAGETVQVRSREEFEEILADPTRWRQREDLFPGGRIAAQGKHVILFRMEGAVLQIVRILHGAMDFPRHLPGERKSE